MSGSTVKSPLGDALNFTSSLATTLLRTGMGIVARPAARRPEKLLELYEFEACPHCRLVREVLTELDLDALIYPCPKGGERYRSKVVAEGGKAQFPYFVDPNTGERMYESAEIIAYLFETYAQSRTPPHWRLVELQRVGSIVASVPRFANGMSAAPSRAPDQPLELYSFESSPFARLVRERLCQLELPYVLRSAGRSTLSDWVPPPLRSALAIEPRPETVNRRTLLARAGSISIPYLVDPNTGTELGESADIIDYLNRTYAL